MNDTELEARLHEALMTLSQVRIPVVRMEDLIEMVGHEAPLTVGQVVRVLARMGMAATPPAGPGAPITLRLDTPAPAADPLAVTPSHRVMLVKVEAAILSLAERGASEPSPEEIEAEVVRLFGGALEPQAFCDALDEIARRPPAPAPFDWQRDSAAAADLGAQQDLGEEQEALVGEFSRFLERVSPADFTGPRR